MGGATIACRRRPRRGLSKSSCAVSGDTVIIGPSGLINKSTCTNFTDFSGGHNNGGSELVSGASPRAARGGGADAAATSRALRGEVGGGVALGARHEGAELVE